MKRRKVAKVPRQDRKQPERTPAEALERFDNARALARVMEAEDGQEDAAKILSGALDALRKAGAL